MNHLSRDSINQALTYDRMDENNSHNTKVVVWLVGDYCFMGTLRKEKGQTGERWYLRGTGFNWLVK